MTAILDEDGRVAASVAADELLQEEDDEEDLCTKEADGEGDEEEDEEEYQDNEEQMGKTGDFVCTKCKPEGGRGCWGIVYTVFMPLKLHLNASKY